MELKNNLQEVQTEELIKELIDRHEYALFIGHKTEEFNVNGYWMEHKGQRHELLGLSEEMNIIIRNHT